MHKHTEEILQAIRAANPSLMELDRGCLIEFTMPDRYHEFSEPEEKVVGEVLYYNIIQSMEDCDVHALAYLEDWAETYDFAGLDESEYIIIGHEPHLEHLLVAIKEKYKSDIGFFVNQYGLCYEMTIEVKTDEDMQPLLKYLPASLGYHLTHSLTQNLEENEPLREILHGLLVVK